MSRLIAAIVFCGKDGEWKTEWMKYMNSHFFILLEKPEERERLYKELEGRKEDLVLDAFNNGKITREKMVELFGE